jgi:histidine ammonia-lyase
VLAVEYLASVQGLDFRAPLKASAKVEQAKAVLRAVVPFYAEDRYFAPDIENAADLLRDGKLTALLPAAMLPSQS